MLEQIIEMLEKVGDSITYYVSGSEIDVVVQDFDGFDEDWCEIDADYDEDAVDGLTEWLEEHCDSHDGDFYHYYYFGEIEVCFGYASFDI